MGEGLKKAFEVTKEARKKNPTKQTRENVDPLDDYSLLDRWLTGEQNGQR